MRRLNNSGFSLVEIMIAAAALAGLAVVGMKLSGMLTKSNTKASFDSEVSLAINEINAILSDPAKCSATLSGRNAVSTTSGITNINGNKFYSLESGSPVAVRGYGNANIVIASYALNATAAEVASNNSKLSINFQNKNILKGTSGQTIISKKINLFVNVDATNKITNCRSLSTSSTDIWTRGSGSTIFYSSGNVGINNNAPATTLDVGGGIKAGDQNQVTVCNAATEGTQRYNKNIHAIEFCGYNAGPPVYYYWKSLGAPSLTCTSVIASDWSQNISVSCPSGTVMTGFWCETFSKRVQMYPPNGSLTASCWSTGETPVHTLIEAQCCRIL